MPVRDVLYILVPCYNEEAVLRDTGLILEKRIRVLAGMGQISSKSRILFIDDGSMDATWDIIKELHERDPMFIGLRLARNAGHQNAVMAGVRYVADKCDAAITIDADLQDDPGVIDKMVDAWRSGHDVIYGVRSDRESDTLFKRFTAESYYRLLHGFGVDIVFNHADFRLMSRRILEALSGFHESGPFLRGLVPMIAHNPVEIEYERHERMAGESKYSLRKMLALASDGAFGLTLKPVRLVRTLGIILFCGCVLTMLLALACGLMSFNTALLCSVWGAAGLVLAGTGVAGEYAGRAYLESKHRPGYFVLDVLDSNDNI